MHTQVNQKSVDRQDFAEKIDQILRFVYLNLTSPRYHNDANLKEFLSSIHNGKSYRDLFYLVFEPEKVPADLFTKSKADLVSEAIAQVNTEHLGEELAQESKEYFESGKSQVSQSRKYTPDIPK